MKMGKKIPLHGGGRAVKSYIHIRDVSRGELGALHRGRQGAIYHLSPEKGISIRDLVRMIAERMGKKFEAVTEMAEERLGQDAAYLIDSSLARRELDWSPSIALEEGVDEVIRWVEGNWEEIRKLPLDYQHKF